MQQAGGKATEAQYSETGKITNRALRTSKPSAIAEIFFMKTQRCREC